MNDLKLYRLSFRLINGFPGVILCTNGNGVGHSDAMD